MHLNSDLIYVETDSESRALITTLRNYTMPLIRYDSGDIVRLSDKLCSCGRPLPIIDQLQGRMSGVITVNGKVIHSELFDYIARGYMNPPTPVIKNFRATRIAEKAFVIEIVTEDGLDTSQMKERIRRKTQAFLGGNIQVVVESKKFIEKETSGKFQFFVDAFSNSKRA